MKEKHLRIRIEQCLALAKASNCPRRKFGALLVDPERNVILMDGYNGGPRNGGTLGGGHQCLRDTMEVQSGTRMEIGCHHAEMNVVCNAAANGVRCRGAWLIVTGEPCLLCAKLVEGRGRGSRVEGRARVEGRGSRVGQKKKPSVQRKKTNRTTTVRRYGEQQLGEGYQTPRSQSGYKVTQ